MLEDLLSISDEGAELRTSCWPTNDFISLSAAVQGSRKRSGQGIGEALLLQSYIHHKMMVAVAVLDPV
jgi:hypothetical protein